MIIKLRKFKEIKGYCGPASLMLVMEYFGVKKTEKEIGRIAGLSKTLGVSDKGIVKAAEHCGFKARIKNNATFEDIQKWLDKKIPVIVDWFTAEGGYCDGHYTPVVGLDNKFIYLQDSEIGKLRKLKRDYFMSVWFDFPDSYIKKKKDLILRRIIVVYPAPKRG